MLYNSLQNAMRESIKTNSPSKDILRLIVSELSTLEARTNKEVTDEQAIKTTKKLVESNTETLKYLKDTDSRFSTLLAENAVLLSFLPQELSYEEVAVKLHEVKQQLIDSKSDGQAIGLAMKFMKSNKLIFNSSMVNECVKQIRMVGNSLDDMVK